MELMVVVAIAGAVTSMAVIQMSASRMGFKGDGGMRVILSQMNQAREMAITQRRSMRVSFVPPNLMQITREEVPGPTTTVVSSVLMEGGVQFVLVTGVPDSPDAFGNSTAVSFGAATEVKFRPDGTLVNQDGAMLNGSIFTANPTIKLSARAVTVLGSTGRVRGYRWDGRAWKPA